MNNNKRGQSTVLSSMLLVSIVVIIAGIIGVFAFTYLEKTTTSSKNSQILNKVQADIIEIYAGSSTSSGGSGGGSGYTTGYTAPTTPADTLKIFVERQDNEDTKTVGLRFIFDLGSKTKSIDIYNDPLNEAAQVGEYDIPYDQIGIKDKSEIRDISVKVIGESGVSSNVLATKRGNEITIG